MMNGFFWCGNIDRVTDQGGMPRVEMLLNESVLIGIFANTCLPRANTSYWLVDDDTFKQFIWKDAD